MNGSGEYLLKVKEAAARLSISPRQVYRLQARGLLPPCVKEGKSSWLPESEVAAYIEKLKQARLELSGGRQT